MNKILILTTILGLMLVGAVGVFADERDNDQPGTVLVETDWTFNINPSPLVFASLKPKSSQQIQTTFEVGTSDLEIINIAVMSTSPTEENIFNEENVKFSLIGSLNVTSYVSARDLSVPVIPGEGSESIWVLLTVPIGTDAGTYEGTITYTIEEA